MTTQFASRLTRQPRPFDPSAAADTARRFADLTPVLSTVLAATAACSPYLASLMAREEPWLRHALTQDPDQALTADLTALETLTAETLAPGLRQTKRRVALWTALCDIGGVELHQRLGEQLVQPAVATAGQLVGVLRRPADHGNRWSGAPGCRDCPMCSRHQHRTSACCLRWR